MRYGARARRCRVPARARAGAFTLVELLIVIAVICILIAALGLSVSGIGRHVKLTKCQGHLKSIHQVLMQYAVANDGWFPEFNHYWGRHIRRPYQWGDGSQPRQTRWQALCDVAQMKEMGGSAEIFFL